MNIDQADDGISRKRSATARQVASTQPARPTTRSASQLPKVKGRLGFDSSTTSNADLPDFNG
ncbi:hypothetical protein SynROS8604_00328 [Synechococcus sp. ROS8604]|nr:hypothetical protein SynROS8604_00328 [Synechococcus sp. ROS8604]